MRDKNNTYTSDELARHAMGSESSARINAMVGLAKTEPEIVARPDEFDSNRWLLNVLNGTIDLRTGQLREHRRQDLITKLAPVFFDPTAKCPRYLRFLDEIMDGDQELIGFHQRAKGYALTGDTREQILIICYGMGSNGKSTDLNTWQTLLGDYALQTPTDTLFRKRPGGIPNDIARLKGARLVVAIEAEEGRRLAESQIKQMTGGDRLVGRFLHKEFFEFVPEFKLFLATNHKPNIRGTDHAIWRRIRLIPFNVIIPDKKQDKHLPQKLLEELPGILNWAIEGCLEWQKNGLDTPTAVKDATKAYRVEMDVLGQFLDACCDQGRGHKESASELYELYKAWCKASSERPQTQNAFGRLMTERGFQKSKHTKTRRILYLGIKLKPRVWRDFDDRNH